MKKTFLLTVALAATVAFTACDNKKTQEEAEREAAQIEAEAAKDLSQLRSDVSGVSEWLGTYEGTMAQADGAGFVSTLELKGDNTFVFKQVANGGEGSTETREGTFTVLANDNLITLNASNGDVLRFLYEGESVLMVDLQGNKPEVEEFYRLMKKMN